jgi:hypothetical protein
LSFLVCTVLLCVIHSTWLFQSLVCIFTHCRISWILHWYLMSWCITLSSFFPLFLNIWYLLRLFQIVAIFLWCVLFFGCIGQNGLHYIFIYCIVTFVYLQWCLISHLIQLNFHILWCLINLLFVLRL